ncbi:hypothetical protein JTE90_026116 [Oedothorax gibbosus]|uniref:Uncharacterized protein n=1 Tax=Oedothorax gibbosus TaxID=931172 RepID=A0AAV6V1R3_9ARAC|nr:hypothetical protein JTE90_026116 [Oedothorax gibbosus]
MSISTVLYFVAEGTLNNDLLVNLGIDDLDSRVVLIKPAQDIIKEVLSPIQQAGSLYAGHVTPNSESFEDIVKSIISNMSEHGFSFENLIVTGFDSTVVNKGWKNCLVRRVELYLRKPVQWAICLLHLYELPFHNMCPTTLNVISCKKGIIALITFYIQGK